MFPVASFFLHTVLVMLTKILPSLVLPGSSLLPSPSFGPCYVACAGLKLTILLPQLLSSGTLECSPSHPALPVFPKDISIITTKVSWVSAPQVKVNGGQRGKPNEGQESLSTLRGSGIPMMKSCPTGHALTRMKSICSWTSIQEWV